MKDAIVVAGGNSARRFQLSNNLDSDQYKVNICQSPEEFHITCGEAKIVAFLLLYPDESGIIGKLFDRNVMSRLIGKSSSSNYFFIVNGKQPCALIISKRG